jgi:hypothetical protein
MNKTKLAVFCLLVVAIAYQMSVDANGRNQNQQTGQQNQQQENRRMQRRQNRREGRHQGQNRNRCQGDNCMNRAASEKTNAQRTATNVVQ